MPELDKSNFNIVCATLGGFITLFGLVSYLFKERLFLSEALISLAAGVTFSPHAIGLIQPLEYASGSADALDSITHAFTRLVLGVQLVLAGVQLPSKYLYYQWKPLALLLGPGMTGMWICSSLLIWALVPNLPFLPALAVGACVTPTDPVLSNSIVKGKFADKNVPRELQRIIIAESGANDGLGYPFLFLALYLFKYVGDGSNDFSEPGGAGAAIGLWFSETWCYEIFLGVAYGATVGWIAKELLQWAEEHRYIDRESFLVFAITLALFIVGTCGMIGSDDVLACFVAGNVFTIDDWFRLETLDDSLQPTIDMLLNLSVFMWFGAVCPWASFGSNDVISVYRLVPLGPLILLFRRLPVVLAMHRHIPQIDDIRQASFVGFFGPIGVSAIFYLFVSLDFLATLTLPDGSQRPDAAHLAAILRVVVWYLAICSIVVHGLSVPLGKLGYHLPRTISSALESRASGEDDDSGEVGPGSPPGSEAFRLGPRVSFRTMPSALRNRAPHHGALSPTDPPRSPAGRAPARGRDHAGREPPRAVFRIGGSVIPRRSDEAPVAGSGASATRLAGVMAGASAEQAAGGPSRTETALDDTWTVLAAPGEAAAADGVRAAPLSRAGEVDTGAGAEVGEGIVGLRRVLDGEAVALE